MAIRLAEVGKRYVGDSISDRPTLVARDKGTTFEIKGSAFVFEWDGLQWIDRAPIEGMTQLLAVAREQVALLSQLNESLSVIPQLNESLSEIRMALSTPVFSR